MADYAPFKPTSHGPSPWWPTNFRNVRRVLLGATKRADTASKLWCLQTPHNVSEFILRPHSLVEERQVLNLLAGVRFSLRPPFLAMSSSDKDAGPSSRLPGFDSRHRLHLRRVAGNGAQHFAKVRQRENVDGVRFPDSPPYPPDARMDGQRRSNP